MMITKVQFQHLSMTMLNVMREAHRVLEKGDTARALELLKPYRQEYTTKAAMIEAESNARWHKNVKKKAKDHA